jgi:hypothetical protein
MGDTIPGSSLVTPAPFGTSSEAVSVDFDRVRIRLVSWNYIDDTLNVQLDYGREDPFLGPGFHEYFVKSQVHPIVDLGAPDVVIINGISFSRLAGAHYTTLKASLGTATETTQENLEDDIFAALVAINYFPLGVETP